MKMRILFGFMFALSLVLVLSTVTTAQQQMTKNDWQEAMKTAKTTQADLQSQATALDKDIADLKTQVASKDADVKACEDALFALLALPAMSGIISSVIWPPWKNASPNSRACPTTNLASTRTRWYRCRIS